MYRKGLVCRVVLALFALTAVELDATRPALDIARQTPLMVPLFDALPVNETFVTAMVRRPADDLIIGATCGKERICLFSFDPGSLEVRMLDSFDALWWDEPRIALGPEGDIYLGARRAYDKQFVFERLRERGHTPGTFRRRDSVPPPDLMNEAAAGMPIRHYSPEGTLLEEVALPEFPDKDGVGALVVGAGGKMLCGLSAPGGRLFTISLQSGERRDYGEVVPLPKHHHTRRVSKALMAADNGKVYLSGTRAKPGTGPGDDASMGFMLELEPLRGQLNVLNARLPAVIGRRLFAAVDAAVQLDDGSFLGGTTDGYLFRFDPESATVEGFGKPLRQHHISGLALGADGLVYGTGGEEGGLPRLFAFDPVTGQMHLGTSPEGTQPEGGVKTFGDIGAVVSTADGTLVCAERERRAYLLVYRQEDETFEWSKTFQTQDQAGEPFEGTTTFTAAEMAKYTRDRFTAPAGEQGGMQLAPTYMISDAMARSSKVHETLTSEVEVRKIFQLPSACRQAEILFFGGGGSERAPLLIGVNGHQIEHRRDRSKMLTGGWDREIIPGHYLHAGRNELTFTGAGFLLIDTDSPGNNSFKRSTEGGSEWKTGILGPNNDLSGEYVIRIRVHGYPPQGMVTSPVIDLTDVIATSPSSTVAPHVEVKSLRLSANTSSPPQTSVRFELRSGSTARYTPDRWGQWQADGGTTTVHPGPRYVQWRAILSSQSAELTPWLNEVTLEVSGRASGANGGHIELVAAPDNAVSASSYAFDYADPHHPRMRHLREKYQLDQVVAAGRTETEKFALLRQWARQQWEGWNDNKYNYCPQWDALEILELAPQNLALGMCTHYATVFAQGASALGYHARQVILDHHCLAEVWSDQHGKWILQDAGLVPGHEATFQYENAGVPVNALEIHHRSRAGNAADIDIVPDPPLAVDQMQRQMVELYRRFAIPLRNDHLYRSEPQELEQGMDQYHWDGHLWWTDSLDPRYPEYSLQSSRPEDFYWTLNKTVIALEDTDSAGTLSVRLSGPIPNLDHFAISLNSDAWQRSESAFAWQLRRGSNSLRARAVNTMDLNGPANLVELEYDDASPHLSRDR